MGAPEMHTDMTPPRAANASRRILSCDIAALTREEAKRQLAGVIAGGGHAKIAFANAHLLNLAAQDDDFRASLEPFMILPDGVGVDLASRWLYGHPFPDNLNGTDFLPHFLETSAAPLRVGLVGARPGIAEKAAAKLAQRAPHHDYRVVSHGFFSPVDERTFLDRLAEAPVDVLLVAMGNPVQERWIARSVTPAHARLAFGVGALFDFLAGEVKRAPPLIRTLRLEWVWRLLMEPRRMWRRYVLGNPLFLLRVARQLAGKPASGT